MDTETITTANSAVTTRKELKRLKVWFDPEKNFYRLFMPNGVEIEAIMSVSVDDKFGRGTPEVQFRGAAQVVNEKPVPNAEDQKDIVL